MPASLPNHTSPCGPFTMSSGPATVADREPGGEVVDALRARRQPPDPGRRADPQRACAIAQHHLDALAAEPDARQLAPLAVAVAQHHAALVADDEPARIGPQRL